MQYTVFAKVQRPKLEAKWSAKKKVISPEIKASESRLFKERAQPVRAELLKFFKKEGLNVSRFEMCNGSPTVLSKSSGDC